MVTVHQQAWLLVCRFHIAISKESVTSVAVILLPIDQPTTAPEHRSIKTESQSQPSLAVSVTGLSDSSANFTADSPNSVVYDFVFFADIWTHLNGLQYYPCLCVRRTITTSYLYFYVNFGLNRLKETVIYFTKKKKEKRKKKKSAKRQK